VPAQGPQVPEGVGGEERGQAPGEDPRGGGSPGSTGARVQEAVQEAVQKLQEDQRKGAQRITDWVGEASSALVPLRLSPIQVAEPAASLADALLLLDSASERLRCLEQVLTGHLEAEGREMIRMVAEHIFTCL